jgi:preprotein translocase subunit SecD
MIESLKARWVIIFISLFLAIMWVLPNFVSLGDNWWFSKEKIIYGLDIQGGLHLVMGVDVEGVMAEKTARLSRNFRDELKDQGIAYQSVSVSEENKTELIVVLKEESDQETFSKYISEYYGTTLQILSQEGAEAHLRYYDAKVTEYRKQVIDQAIEVIRNRIDEFGVAEPSIAAQGDNRILVQLPGIKDSARAKELINRTARLNFRPVSEEKTLEELNRMVEETEKKGNYSFGAKGLGYSAYIKKINEDLKDKLPKDTRLVFQKSDNAVNLEAGRIPFLVKTDNSLSGSELEDANVRPDEYGTPEVIFRFTVDGRRKFSDMTEKNVGKRVAIVLDSVVQSAPNIQEKINSATARITLGSTRNYQETMNEANFIATALRAGALPAALEQLEERTVGPTLGADSIRKGKKAGIIGGILVLIFMLLYYRTLGVVADIALSINVLFILAILTSLGATLTLPGVAGIVLTVGMAVDANIIIFERIKEELRKGIGLQSAIKDGFGHAFSAIFDANITTAAVCVVLMYYGTGPVRGFAVTLICGIVTSMFTSIFISRAILDFMVGKLKMTKIVPAN